MKKTFTLSAAQWEFKGASLKSSDNYWPEPAVKVLLSSNYAFSLHLLISRCSNIMKPFLACIKTMLTQ